MKTFISVARLGLILFFCSAGVLAQEPNKDPFRETGLTGEQRAEVVRRILRWYIAPSPTPRVIPLLNEGIDASWLPEIKNVQFRLIWKYQVGEYDQRIRFFKPLEKEGRRFYIGFGDGDPYCDSQGDTWAFRIDRARVRLWKIQAGWGTGCGNASAPAIPSLTIGTVSPHELPGYEFFKRGKLGGLRLGVSRREDLIALFGSTCEGGADYDDNWSIWVNYFDKHNGGSVTSGGAKTLYYPKDEFIGTLAFIRLSPKNRVSFAQVKFPGVFYRSESFAIGDCWNENGFCGAAHSTIINYGDSYGLTYEVFDKETFRNTSGRNARIKGDLLGIEYRIPNDFESGIYNAVSGSPEK